MKVYVSKTHLYKIYYGIKNRCYNTKDANYKKYGAKGILMADEWLEIMSPIDLYLYTDNFLYQVEKVKE